MSLPSVCDNCWNGLSLKRHLDSALLDRESEEGRVAAFLGVEVSPRNPVAHGEEKREEEQEVAAPGAPKAS